MLHFVFISYQSNTPPRSFQKQKPLLLGRSLPSTGGCNQTFKMRCGKINSILDSGTEQLASHGPRLEPCQGGGALPAMLTAKLRNEAIAKLWRSKGLGRPIIIESRVSGPSHRSLSVLSQPIAEVPSLPEERRVQILIVKILAS